MPAQATNLLGGSLQRLDQHPSTGLVMVIVGFVLALIPRAIYSFDAHAPRTWGPAPLADQQIAGVTMAAEEAIVFFGAFTAYLLRFLADEQASGLSRNASGRAGDAPPVGLRAAPGSAPPRR